MDIIVAGAIVGAVIVVCGLLDIWLGRHPLKKADKKANKYRYKSDF